MMPSHYANNEIRTTNRKTPNGEFHGELKLGLEDGIQWPFDGHSLATQWPYTGQPMAIQWPHRGHSMA
eukprot:6076223-Lingulodinium_polyedra.AAC.1